MPGRPWDLAYVLDLLGGHAEFEVSATGSFRHHISQTFTSVYTARVAEKDNYSIAKIACRDIVCWACGFNSIGGIVCVINLLCIRP